MKRVIESPASSSDLVVRGTPHAIEITLDPMVNPIERLDVYPEDVDEFVEAVRAAATRVDGAGDYPLRDDVRLAAALLEGVAEQLADADATHAPSVREAIAEQAETLRFAQAGVAAIEMVEAE